MCSLSTTQRGGTPTAQTKSGTWGHKRYAGAMHLLYFEAIFKIRGSRMQFMVPRGSARKAPPPRP